MTIALVTSDAIGFADGAAGHLYTFPGGAPSAGQLDILAVNSDTTVSTPAGWTLAVSYVGNQGSYIWYRIATGTEGSTVTITTNGNNNTEMEWSRWSGASALDIAVEAHAESVGVSSPSVSSGTLSATSELVLAFAAMANIAALLASPSWSAGYTPLNSMAQGGADPHGVAAFTAYRTDAGTAAETPSVSWTNSAYSRYLLAVSFSPAAVGTPDVPASSSPTVTAPRDSTTTVTASVSSTTTVTAPVSSAPTVGG